MSDVRFETALSIPSGFRFGEASSLAEPTTAPLPAPSLGPLSAFTGTFRGTGFNTIFRPQNAKTPTPLPTPVPGSDNVLELNLTEETLSFSASLGAVPNRGEVQGDIILNGVSYLQTINDVTIPGQSVGIHLEPGLWMAIPATTDPDEAVSLVRMGSIPHGTTIQAQGTSIAINGKPNIQPIGITPFTVPTPTQPGQPVTFPSQTATATDTARIPQDLTSFIKAGTITQEMLTDPTTLLRNHIESQTITATTVISIATTQALPLFGGGTSNMAFLLGNAAALSDPADTVQNAQAVAMQAIFWIETVEYTIPIPAGDIGSPVGSPITVTAESGPGPDAQPVPDFLVTVPASVKAPLTIKATATQIQYAQQVFLNFNGLTWPHVTVATLVPAAPVPVPAPAFG
jgi:hypothetical protein